ASHEHTMRLSIVAGADEIKKVLDELTAQFGSRIVTHSIVVPAFELELLEIFDPAVNKWEGILHVARHHGIEPRQIIAIGDDVNDIHMIRHAGLGVAMGNARPEVRAAARLVIESNKDDGLAQFLEKLSSGQLRVEDPAR
ncbi:MAG TPA: HAD hydrolase family protein, partial [Tepidisphaeraceae bacterium]|nr:HAD hydrolase family protein [Tepidisphaeraceae bacterium]